jgi:hypothetical protein
LTTDMVEGDFAFHGTLDNVRRGQETKGTKFDAEP